MSAFSIGASIALGILAICLAYFFEHAPALRYKRRKPNLLISSSVLLTAFAVIVLPLGSIPHALATLIVLITLIGVTSKLKYGHTQFNLVIDDLWHLSDGAAQFVHEEYRRLTILFIGFALLLLGMLAALLMFMPWEPIPVFARLTGLAASLLLMLFAVKRGSGLKAFNVFLYTSGHSHVSGFLISCFLRYRPEPGLRLSGVATEPLALPEARSASNAALPDIIVIQHESTFDPCLYGLPVGRQIKNFIAPPGALNGRLHVGIFGGHSWITEFSFLTGISALCFGANSRYIYHKAAGRIHHSLPLFCRGLGYSNAMMTPTSRRFLNYDAFYESIGVEERLFMFDLGPPFDHPELRKHCSDAVFYDLAEAQLQKMDRDNPGPHLLILLTSFNHGPHTRRRLRHKTSKKGRRFALSTFPDPEYGEYYARLMFCCKAYAAFRERLLATRTQRPTLIIRYGDHQPKLVQNLLKAKRIAVDDPRTLQTFYSIEGINLELDLCAKPQAAPLDIAFLSTIALKAAGIPLDPIRCLHDSLIAECGKAYHATPSKLKERYHRTLLEHKLVEAQA